MLDRRSLLTLTAGLVPGAALAQGATPAPTPPPAPLAADDPRMAERSVGRADAPVTVIEYFSLTCSHCAAFHRDTFPKVKSDLIDTGRLRLVYRDFPLDGLALAGSAVARSLPPEHYPAFISTLLSTQDRWAFARGADPREEMAKLAALAGMSRAKFDEALADQALARAILAARVAGQQEHNVTSTPSFVFGSRTVPGAIPYARFAELVNEAR